MAKSIKEDWEMKIITVEDGRYLQKVFIHTSTDCRFTEKEYKKRTDKGE